MQRPVRHWLLIILATVLGVALPLAYFWRFEITFLLRERLTRAQAVAQVNWYVTDTYLAAPAGAATIRYASSTGRYLFRGQRRVPSLSAEAYLVADLDTGQLIIERNSQAPYPIASITKLMTSVVSLETLDQNQLAQVSRSAMNAFGYAGQLSPGEKFRVSDLLYPLLLESSNKTAEVIAETGGRNNFLAQMNDKAKFLKLEKTHYEDPSGLSPRNVSSAQDLAALSKYIFDYHPAVLDITLEKTHHGYGRTWYNKNKLTTLDHYLGGKDGYTEEAQTTDISLFSLPLATASDRRVVIVLLRTSHKLDDIKSLLDYLKSEVTYAG